MKDDKREFEVGDKIVVNDYGLCWLKITYDPEDIQFLEDTVYGIVAKIGQIYPDNVTVNWVNHKGMITQYQWYIRKAYIDLYQDVPRET